MKKIYSLLLFAGLFLLGAQNVMATDYCVAGTMTSWSDGSAMVYDAVNGYYYTEFNDHMSGEQQFKIKVVGDGSWNPQWNASKIDNSLGDGTITLSGSDNIVFTPNGRPYIIYFSLASNKVWACDKVILEPFVSLASDKVNLLAGETVTLTATAENFSGAVTYAYSYSTDGGTNYTPIATTASNTQTFTMGASGTAYKFKVVATYNTEESSAVIDVNSVVVTAVGALGTKAADADDEVFGTAWAPANDNNDMTYKEGVFTWSKEKVYLSTGTIQCKVVYNHSWDINYPADNVTCVIENAGFYDVTITFNWSTHAVSAVATYLYPAVVSIAHSQDTYVAHDIAYDSEAGNFHTTLHLVPGEVATSFLFYVSKATTQHLKNDGVMTREYNQDWTFAEGDVDARIDVDVEGNYVFTYNPANNKVSVDYPNFKRTVGTNYISICLPYEVATLSNATAYEISSTNQDAVIITSVELPLDAGKPYIIKPTEPGEIEATFQNVNNKVTDNAQAINGILHGNLTATPIVLDPNDAMDYFYVLSNNEVKLVAEGGQGDQVTVGQYRAYAAMPRSAISAPSYRIIEANNGATDINNVEANETAVKFIENGQLFIQKNGVVYNAVGAVVK